MSWNPSSRLAALIVIAAVLVAAVTPAAAISTDAQNVPDDAKVGDKVTSTVTLTELYSNYEQWTLDGETELKQVTWTVTRYDQADNKIGQKSYDGQSFNQSISLENDVDSVTVEVTGVVPEIEEYSYDPAQTFSIASLSQTRKGGNSEPIEEWSVHSYTDESRQARRAIESASASIREAKGNGASTSDARSTLDNAISSYDNSNFENAVSLAEKAEKSANSAKKSSSTKQTLLYAGGGIVVLAVLVGGVFWWRSNQDSYDKLG